MNHFQLIVLLRFVSVYSQILKRTDMNKCKITHTGIEYAGDISHTQSGVKCQQWNSIDSSYHIFDAFTDNDFPEGSKLRARNFCRNVKGRFKAPWCYTKKKDLNDEICDIPLCNFDCRRTIIGAEYGGSVNVSLTGRHCLKWSEKIYRKYLKRHSNFTNDKFLLDEKFPELSRKKALNYCRNPTMDPNGPWCLVDYGFSDEVKYEKEYCNVELCNYTNCAAGTNRFTDNEMYTHFINMTDSEQLKFSILLWNTDFKNRTFRIAFSVYPLPLSAQKLADLDNGIELLISKHGLGFVEKTGKVTLFIMSKSHWKNIYNLLSSHQKRTFTVTWHSPKINVEILGHSSYITVTYNYELNNGIINNNKGQFTYYSIIGDPALWDLPCHFACREEITILPHCNFYRKMNKTEDNYVMSFIVRSDQTVYIQLRDSPNSKYPYLKIQLYGLLNETSISLYENSDLASLTYKCGSYTSFLSYWSWTQLKLSATEDLLQLEWLRPLLPSQTICSFEHVTVANAKWFSICSVGTAHWMFGCERIDIPTLPKNKLPECAVHKTGLTYAGHMWVSKSGQPCFPWIYNGLDEYTKNFSFVSTNRKKMVNYCRNLIGDNDGPFCYIADVNKLPELSMKKESCSVRICPISQCKVTGSGVEYDGNLNTTRANRVCKAWAKHDEKNNQTLRNISVTNNTLFENLTKNYCRNPNNNTFGPWCFTTDKRMPVDLCNIRDCSLKDEFTLINTETKPNSRIYIHPDWVTDEFFINLRSWDPHLHVGVALNISFKDDDYFLLEIGAENDTKVKLSYIDRNGNLKLVQENVIGKLIPTGYWQGFWFSLPPNDIEFGYEGSTKALFSWVNTKDSGVPLEYCKYVSFSNLGNYSVGLNFPETYCLVHQIFTNFQTGFYPFNFGDWTRSTPSKMLLYLRNDVHESNGYALIKFFEYNEFHFISIMINNTHILLTDEKNSVLNHIDGSFLGKSWISLTISYNDSHINVRTNNNVEFHWKSFHKRPFRLYYFVITAHDTIISWLSNCNPPPDDSHTIDGGWSEWGEWKCSVTCGGGIGYRTRNCSNPTPSFYGKPCVGVNTEDGECNKFECGCINPDTYKRINSTLESQAISREANAGQDASFECARNFVNEMKSESPGSYLGWLKNGYKMNDKKLQFGEIQIEETDLKLRKVKEEDTGIYICVVYPDCLAPNNATFVIITIVAFVVNSDQVHDARETTNYQLMCKGLILSFIYVDLTQFWLFENELMADYIMRPLDEVDMDYISEVEPSHAGNWTCKVAQKSLKLIWTTNKLRLKVIDPPSLYVYITTEDAPSFFFEGWNPTFVALFLKAIVILEIAGVGYTAYWYWTTRRELLGLRNSEN